MVIGEQAASACIDEQTALDFVRGRLPGDQVTEVDEHADACARCQVVLAEASRAFRERSTGALPGAAIPMMRFAPGDKLASRYRILRFIARGGMGEVYEAHDLILNTRLALKTLAATISDDPNAIRRLKQEVNLARLITHPNVCRIFDIGVHEQSIPAGGPPLLFITMELVAGESLGHRLRTSGRVTPEIALPIAQAMTSALGAAHVANVVHRDFKSDNVMLSPDETGATRTVVMDFGLARAALGSDLASVDNPTLAGTLAYMAPEQLEGKPVGPASDIYALGVVLFEMLTGELPFKGEPALAAAWRRVAEPAPSLSGVVPDLDRGWQRIVASCLERDPHNRPASADDVGRALQELDTARAREPEKTPRDPGRRLLVSSAMLSGVALAGLSWLVVKRSPEAPARPQSTVVAKRPPGSALAAPEPPPPGEPSPKAPSQAAANPESDSPAGVPTLSPHTGNTSRVSASLPIKSKPRSGPGSRQPAKVPFTGASPAITGLSTEGGNSSTTENAAPQAPAVAPPEQPAARTPARKRSTDKDDGFILP